MEERKFNALVNVNGNLIFKQNININEYYKDLYCVYDGMLHYKMSDHAQRISFIADNSDILSDEEIEYLLKDIDFEESDIYEKLAENNTNAEDIMSVPKLAEMVNHYAIWSNLPISFTIDKDTTLEEYEDYIYDELGLDIEDYLIEERYNCIIEDLKNED